MRILDYSSQFKKDFKKLLKSSPQDIIEFGYVVGLLQRNQLLPEKYYDHGLTGNWYSYKECHIKPDLLLIYKQDDNNNLKLARLGSHSDLF